LTSFTIVHILHISRDNVHRVDRKRKTLLLLEILQTIMSLNTSTFELPVVDFTAFVEAEVQPDGPTEAQIQTAKALDEACRSHGFVCLRNTGISKEAVQRTFDASKTLFQGTDKAKSKLKQLDFVSNTGYIGFGVESLNRRRGADMKEAFNVRMPKGEDCHELFTGTSSDFGDTATKFWKDTTTLSKRFAECCAIALGLEIDFFAKTLEEYNLSTCRMLHYPPCRVADSEQEGDPKSAIRVGEHTDFGIFTFLFINNIQDKSSTGLQVKPVEGGDLGSGSLVALGDDMFTTGWKDVVFDQTFLDTVDKDTSCSVMVNTGALMARWTNDEWRATAHRVVVKPEARDSHRYTIACFFDPDKKTICSVDPKFVADGETPKYPPISSLDYLQMKLREVQCIDDEEPSKE
jgi:isopenicillin N synthase-like dioxygenase